MPLKPLLPCERYKRLQTLSAIKGHLNALTLVASFPTAQITPRDSCSSMRARIGKRSDVATFSLGSPLHKRSGRGNAVLWLQRIGDSRACARVRVLEQARELCEKIFSFTLKLGHECRRVVTVLLSSRGIERRFELLRGVVRTCGRCTDVRHGWTLMTSFSNELVTEDSN